MIPEDTVSVLGAEARRALRMQSSGALSTISVRLGGYPFGSLVPYVLDQQARPILLISRLAEHTRNIAVDGRVSLLATDQVAGDLQSGARVTVIGDAEQVPDAELQSIRARYLSYFPQAARLLALGDFTFHAIRPRTLRFIGGFGRIHWIAAEQYAPPENELAHAEAGIVMEINRNQASALNDCARRHGKLGSTSARLIGVDCEGFDLRTGDGQARVDFPRTVLSAQETMTALAELLKSGMQR